MNHQPSGAEHTETETFSSMFELLMRQVRPWRQRILLASLAADVGPLQEPRTTYRVEFDATDEMESGDDVYGDPLRALGFLEHGFRLDIGGQPSSETRALSRQYLEALCRDDRHIDCGDDEKVVLPYTGRLRALAIAMAASDSQLGMWALFETLAYINALALAKRAADESKCSKAHRERVITFALRDAEHRFRRTMGGRLQGKKLQGKKSQSTSRPTVAGAIATAYEAEVREIELESNVDISELQLPTGFYGSAFIDSKLREHASVAAYHVVSILAENIVPGRALDSDVTCTVNGLPEHALPIPSHWTQHAAWTQATDVGDISAWTPLSLADKSAAEAWLRSCIDGDKRIELNDERFMAQALFALLCGRNSLRTENSEPPQVKFVIDELGGKLPGARAKRDGIRFFKKNVACPEPSMLFIQALRFDDALIRRHGTAVDTFVAQQHLTVPLKSECKENFFVNTATWLQTAKEARRLLKLGRAQPSGKPRFATSAIDRRVTESLTVEAIESEPGCFKIRDVPREAMQSWREGQATISIFISATTQTDAPLTLGDVIDVEDASDEFCDVLVEALCDGDSPIFEVWDEKVTIDTDVSLDAFVLRAVAGDIASDICGIAIAVRVRQ